MDYAKILKGQASVYGNKNIKDRSLFSFVKDMVRKNITVIALLPLLSVNYYNTAHAENTSVFDGQLQNHEDNVISKSSVFIVAENKEKTLDFIGTGTIVKNSKTEQNSYNKILTALHVVSREGMKDLLGESSSNDKYSQQKSDDFTIKIFNSEGVLLGYGTLDTYSRPHSIHSQDEKVKEDIAVMSIVPINNIYKNIEGVSLSDELPDKPFFAQSNNDVGFTHGASGSGVFANGKLIGVFNNFISYKNEADTLLSVVGKHLNDMNLKPLFFEEKGALPSWFENTLANVTFKNNYGEFAPIGTNKEIMDALGNAGVRSHVVPVKDKEKISIFGYPAGIGVVYKTNIQKNFFLKDAMEKWFQATFRGKKNDDKIPFKVM